MRRFDVTFQSLHGGVVTSEIIARDEEDVKEQMSIFLCVNEKKILKIVDKGKW